MRKFTQEAAIAAIELEQLVVDYWREVDDNDAADIVDFYTEDCIADFGSAKFLGHEGIRSFYDGRRKAIEAQQDGTPRTGRHIYCNLQVVMDDADRATLRFIITTYSGSGALPVLDATLPTAISEALFDARRIADASWRITAFHGRPLFIGHDPLARQMLAKK